MPPPLHPRIFMVTGSLGWVQRVFWIVLTAAIGFTTCSAAPPNTAPDPNDEFSIQVWTTEDGLPQNIVTTLIQTRAGYIWSGSFNGIAQFDGEHFRVFDAAQHSGLTNSRVSFLFEGTNRDIWIGHETGDLTRYANGRFVTIPPNVKWLPSMITGIQSDAQGDVWAINLLGQAIRIRDQLFLDPPAEMKVDSSLVPQLLLDDQHRLLMVRNNYLAEITPSGFKPLELIPGPARFHYYHLANAQRGGLWILGEGRVRRWATNQWQEDFGPVPWEKASVMATLESSSGQLFVGTLERGLFVHDPTSGWMNLNRSNGLPQDWIRCLTEDSEKNVWAGTGGGLVVLRPRSVVMLNAPDHWAGRPVQGIMQARDGSIWAGTEGSGVYRFHNHVWTNYAGASGLDNLFAWTVMQDSSDRIWVGTWGGGLFVSNGEKFVPKYDLAARGIAVTSLLESPPGTVWMGTAAGLMRSAGDTLEMLASHGGAAAGDVRALAAGTNGAVWFGTMARGLGCYHNNVFQFWSKTNGLPSNFVLSLYPQTDDRLWIGTLDQGVCLYEGGKFYSITTQQGLPNNNIGHIEDDGLGHLWFNSQQGLFRADQRELLDCAYGKISRVRTLVFGKAEGLATLAGSSGFSPSGFRAADGKLWFPTSQGLAVVNPRTVRRNLVAPQVWIESVLVDGQPLEIKNSTPPKQLPRQFTKMVELKPGQRQIEIQFTGLSFISPDRVEFKYKLEGLDKDWTESGTRRRVTYPFIPYGKYVFRVTACNNDGYWNETGDALELIVPPLVWQTLWFKALCAVGCFALVGAAVALESRRRHRRKLERLARESALERERSRIAQDIHDDLGASLTRIGMLSESATADLHDPPRATASLGQIHSTARDLTRTMDEIVWAVDPRHDTLESLTNYITRFAHDFLSAAHIRCRLDAPLGIPDVIVRSEIRHNLFLAFKETLNNAVKHSGATEVRVLFQFNEDTISLVVTDNGNGFDAASPLPSSSSSNRLVSGYGMNGIRQRLHQVGGETEIRSRKGVGTTVVFTLSIPNLIHARKNSHE